MCSCILRRGTQIQVERATEALNHDDTAGAAVADARIARPVPQLAKHRLREHSSHRAAEIVVPGKEISKPVRQAQDPLAHGHIGEDVVDQMRGALGHPATATAWTESAVMRCTT